MGRLRVALYHHLPPGGAARAMTELVSRSSDEIEHVAYTIDPGQRDRHTGRSDPLDGLGLERHVEHVRGGSPSRLREWAITVPQLLRAERRIAALIDRGKFDAVVVHHQRHTQAPGVLRHLRTPSAYFVQEPRRQSFEHDLRPRIAGRGPTRILGAIPIKSVDTWARRFDITSTRSATELMCNSENSREYIWRAYAREATVIPLGVDLDWFTPDPDPYESGPYESGAGDNSDQGPEILMVAAVERPKGIDLAIRAVAAIESTPRPTLRVVHNRANPAYQHEIVNLAAEFGVNLILDSNVSESDLVVRYRRADACLLTSRLEPLGLTALEAAACGTPVVAIREGGYRETVIDGVTGLLTDRDPSALASALSRVIDRSAGLDPVAVRSAVQRTRAWSDAIDRYVAVVARTAGR